MQKIVSSQLRRTYPPLMDSPEHEIHGTNDRNCICKHVLENTTSVEGTVHSSFGSYIYEEEHEEWSFHNSNGKIHTSHHEVRPCKMSKSWSTDLASVWTVRPISTRPNLEPCEEVHRRQILTRRGIRPSRPWGLRLRYRSRQVVQSNPR